MLSFFKWGTSHARETLYKRPAPHDNGPCPLILIPSGVTLISASTTVLQKPKVVAFFFLFFYHLLPTPAPFLPFVFPAFLLCRLCPLCFSRLSACHPSFCTSHLLSHMTLTYSPPSVPPFLSCLHPSHSLTSPHTADSPYK